MTEKVKLLEEETDELSDDMAKLLEDPTEYI